MSTIQTRMNRQRYFLTSATTVDKSLDIDYGMKGNKAVFEVFTEDPVILENGKAKKKKM